MKYTNAAEVLPKKLLMEVQTYINGDILYIPKSYIKKRWGELNGSREYYKKRNQDMKEQYQNGKSIGEIANQYGLAFDTVKKIIYT